MKKLIFFILLLISAILAYNVIDIIIFDFNRLTEYGLGYLTGLFLMLLVSLVLTVFTGIRIFKKNG